MGAVKRNTYNQLLMDGTDYTNTGCLKNILSNMEGLEKLFTSGDQVAGAILIDLKTCLGLYRKEECKLTEMQRQVILLNLVYGIPQDEVSDMLKISQRMVSHHLKQGLKSISKTLQGGE